MKTTQPMNNILRTAERQLHNSQTLTALFLDAVSQAVAEHHRAGRL